MLSQDIYILETVWDDVRVICKCSIWLNTNDSATITLTHSTVISLEYWKYDNSPWQAHVAILVGCSAKLYQVFCWFLSYYWTTHRLSRNLSNYLWYKTAPRISLFRYLYKVFSCIAANQFHLAWLKYAVPLCAEQRNFSCPFFPHMVLGFMETFLKLVWCFIVVSVLVLIFSSTNNEKESKKNGRNFAPHLSKLSTWGGHCE